MANFVVESKDRQVLHDFSFFLLEGIKYVNWFHGDIVHSYMLSEDMGSLSPTFLQSSIPIGSIQFTLDFYQKYYGIAQISPLHIPESLRKEEYLHRKVFTSLEVSDIDPNKVVFAKSLHRFKGYLDFQKLKDLPPEEEYFISETVDILSEWRGFVHRGKLLDVRNYAGDFRIHPDFSLMEDMIGSYVDAPSSYTIDVGVTEGNKTAIIEIHQFFSCGLYGFRDYQRLLSMFISSHRDILEKRKGK